jgi:hypothetical protein
VAALAGAAFLASVCASQWPGSPNAAPIYFQLDVTFALLVLAAIGAGRYLGIDYFFGLLKGRSQKPQEKAQGAGKK